MANPIRNRWLLLVLFAAMLVFGLLASSHLPGPAMVRV